MGNGPCHTRLGTRRAAREPLRIGGVEIETFDQKLVQMMTMVSTRGPSSPVNRSNSPSRIVPLVAIHYCLYHFQYYKQYEAIILLLLPIARHLLIYWNFDKFDLKRRWL